MEWISVKDRLPMTDTGVLTYTIDEEEELGFLSSEDGEWYNRYARDEIFVTHWIPFPDKPKKEGAN